MKFRGTAAMFTLLLAPLAGCVSSAAHDDALVDLQRARIDALQAKLVATRFATQLAVERAQRAREAAPPVAASTTILAPSGGSTDELTAMNQHLAEALIQAGETLEQVAEERTRFAKLLEETQRRMTSAAAPASGADPADLEGLARRVDAYLITRGASPEERRRIASLLQTPRRLDVTDPWRRRKITDRLEDPWSERPDSPRPTLRPLADVDVTDPWR